MTALPISEHLRDDGSAERTALVRRGDALALVVDDAERGRLTDLAVVVVMRRYGRPLDPAVAAELATAPTLALVGDRRLAHLRWRAAVDAAEIGRAHV